MLDLLRDEANDLFLSAASGWEIAIKHALGGLPLNPIERAGLAPAGPDSPASRWLLELVALVAVGVSVVAVARAWPELPARVPMHFDLAGDPDGWGARGSVLLLPGTAVFLYLLLSAVQRMPAHWCNYPVAVTDENRERQHRLAKGMIVALKAAICGLFAHLTLGVLETALGRAAGLGPWLVFGWLAVIFGLIGVYLTRAFRAR